MSDAYEQALRAKLATADATICEILEILRAAGIHEGDTVQDRVKQLVAQRDELLGEK